MDSLKNTCYGVKFCKSLQFYSNMSWCFRKTFTDIKQKLNPDSKKTFFTRAALSICFRILGRWVKDGLIVFLFLGPYMLHKNNISCQQKQDDPAQKKHFVLKKVINFYRNSASYLRIDTHTYRRSASFSENFGHVLNKWPLVSVSFFPSLLIHLFIRTKIKGTFKEYVRPLSASVHFTWSPTPKRTFVWVTYPISSLKELRDVY